MKNEKIIAGVDEVGRGCLAGPVVSAAVILKKGINLKLLKDSKKISFNKREKIADVYLECNENMRGFGGVCLPKDTAALDSLAKELNLDVDFFRMIISENKKYKTTVFKGMRL